MLPEFNYTTARQSKSVVVLAAGPSLLENISDIKRYIKENNSIVIGTNYNYPIDSDYAFFGDPDRFHNSMCDIKSKEILVARDLKGRFKRRYGRRVWRDLIKGKVIYRWGFKMNKRQWRFNKKQVLDTDPEGGLLFRPGTSAFAAMIVASACRPEKILIVGLDGPEVPDKGRLIKHNFNGKVRRYRSMKHYRMKKMMIKHKVIRFLKSKDIQLEAFSNCKFWGLDKDLLGVHVINVQKI